MERLTKTYSDGTHGAADNLPCGENSYAYKQLLLDALGKYEDLEKRGLLVRLPCKAGDSLYKVVEYAKEPIVEMQVDHLKPVYVHGEYLGDMDSEQLNDISNFIPACRQCNLYKSTFELEEFRERLKDTMMENLRKDFRYRLAVKYGLIEEKEQPIVFYFEKMEEKS